MRRIDDGKGGKVEQITVKVRERREGELREEVLVEGGSSNVVGRLTSSAVVIIIGGDENVGREGEDVAHAEIKRREE